MGDAPHNLSEGHKERRDSAYGQKPGQKNLQAIITHKIIALSSPLGNHQRSAASSIGAGAHLGQVLSLALSWAANPASKALQWLSSLMEPSLPPS